MDGTMDDGPVVRFNKRRKIHPRRADEPRHSNDEVPAANPAAQTMPPNTEADVTQDMPSPSLDPSQSAEISVAELLRRRKQAKARRGGIEFTKPSSSIPHSGSSRSQALVAASTVDDASNALEAAQSRFAPQTGTVTESNNQHMMAFIDAEMQRLRAGGAADATGSKNISNSATASGVPLNLPDRQPAALGQIQEIDLGPDAAMRNIAMTEAATRRLQNGQPLDLDENGPQQKVRLGRDGKPRKPRKRRGSDDLKRDEVVEAVLRENRLELYDESGSQLPGDANNDGDVDAADDIIAEQFQRDFLEAIQSRNRMRRAPAPAATAKKGALDEKSRGPKLGGSRSARAAMHAAEKAKTGKR